MASSGPGPGVKQPTAQDIADAAEALEDYNENINQDVDKWIRQAYYIPKNIDYDWFPFCRALIENHQSAKSIFPDPPSPAISPPKIQNRPKDVIAGIQPPDGLGLAPKLGKDWTCVRYIPAWMDPEYTDDKFVTPGGRKTLNSVRDAVYNLRPALRLSDQIRRPTDYALRFGIAADRLDGRSRFSPTWSSTRNPLELDFSKQVEQLSEENRQLALELSLKKWKEMGATPTPGHEILPDVIEQMLGQHGLMSNKGLAADLEKDLSKGRSLDEMVEHIRSVKPDDFQAHQGFLDMLQDDQDYQRILLLGMTTDELVQNNIHTMSNDVLMDLDNVIHPFFDRNRWEDGWWRGRDERTPRNAYNINGTREEYNIVTNDALWEALQPALRLVSMVLAKKHPHLEAIINMNTRQPIPVKKGEASKKFPPTDTRYVLEKDIDMRKTYSAIRQLHEVYNYDWRANVIRVLNRSLRLDIDSGYTLGMANRNIDEPITKDAHASFTFAATSTHRSFRAPGAAPNPFETIKIKLAADLLWPLLVPQYSKSEKMSFSWVIASTLLHEFAHAINQAQELLTTEHWQPPGQDPQIGRLLHSLNGVVWDVDFGAHQEPYYVGNVGSDELGFDFEHALWGRSISLTVDSEAIPRFHRNLMFALGEETHPASDRAQDNQLQPMMRYMRPIPIDYIAKFFSKSFWNEEFGAYGFAAMRMMPDNYLQKNLLFQPTVPDLDMDDMMYSRNKARFLRAVPEILLRSRHHVLGTYLNALRMELADQHQYELWWQAEARNWDSDLLHPLEGTIVELDADLQKTRDLTSCYIATPRERMSQYRAYCTTNSGDPNIMTYLEWQSDVKKKWYDMLKHGGWLMQRLLVVHNQMQADIGDMQRMTFWHLAVKPQQLELNYKPIGPIGDKQTVPSLLRDRLNILRAEAKRIATMLTFYANLGRLANIKDKWEQWIARFRSNGEQYDKLTKLLRDGGKKNSEPFDVSWKVRFDRLPTGSWKQVSEIHKKMAFREFNRADPAIRDTVERFLKNYLSFNIIDTKGIKTSVRKIRGTLSSLQSIGTKTASGKSTMFSFLPSPQTAAGPSVPPASQPPQLFQPQPSPTPSSSGFVFGVPAEFGAMETTGGSTAPRRLTPGVQKPKRDAAKNAAYQNYVTNLLTTPDPKLTSGTASELFKSGLPQPIVDLLPSQKQALGTSEQIPVNPFQNPWASRGVMTSVDATFQHTKSLSNKSRGAVTIAGGRYAAPSLWREKKKAAPDSDSDVEMKDADDKKSNKKGKGKDKKLSRHLKDFRSG
ncbi:hypothetical protein F4679DRAFT_593662 [Xylaria curta]|nr:hypothetical protein F4679DRAFT_593662 [Xylaria curta]